MPTSPLRKLLPIFIAALMLATGGAPTSGAQDNGAPTDAAALADANWPQWRGPTGMGISTDTALPLSWGLDENLAWMTPIAGKGHSSPIVWGDRVFVTSAVEGEVGGEPHRVPHMRDGFFDENPAHRERYLHADSVGSDRLHRFTVIALDAADGSVLWERVAFEGLPYDDRHRGGSFASPTPATDGEQVFAYFGAEGLFAYDLDGNPTWSVDLGDIPNWGLGDGSSPILAGDLLIVVADRDNGDESFIVGIDKRTGATVWETARTVRTQWSTPLLAQGPAGDELVVSGFQYVAGYDPATGAERWRAPGLRGNVIASPVAADNRTFVSMGHPRKMTLAINLGGRGELEGPQALPWTVDKGTAYVASNILYEGKLYLVADNGMLTAIDAATGELVYEGGRPPVPARFYSSPVAYDGKLLMASADGDMFVIRAGEEYEVLAINSIDEPIWASPAIAAGSLFVRGAQHLFCFRNLGNDD